MDEEIQGGARDTHWGKAIPRARDRMQSLWLVVVVVPALVLAAVGSCVGLVLSAQGGLPRFPVAFSVAFAALVWAMRSATLPAAGVGLLVCLTLSLRGSGVFFARPSLSALIVLFVLTFGATRYGRRKKEARGLAEARSGRRASQVVANLGVAALFAALGWDGACLAALAEATADTLSSEIGQALGGTTWLITKFRRVPAGRDGGVSVAGTLAGVVGAGLVVMVGLPGLVRWRDGVVVFVCACAGLAFDSVLGATVEERGWLGNDLVNFCSTLFAAGLARLWL
ncbi:DUF92 domain-containing protein [Tunturiibacter gelidoferens]|jgi:uncharacterized protein (TIGR00297 family)|uniref:Uncharacterized protein (TIGR00297 family) n=1 Tax=Tunturiibacter gelidiferens TaxID=3069689 RepID=A0A9X0QCZ1_9BACT|nr:DUF92 domain-containing protein [Edaphobacter lichenicola]MBB5328216.1 uncharacterized protein (TIGR00297 family) [Edaphobacter lichenicola]